MAAKLALPTPTIMMERGFSDAVTILSTVFCMSVITPSCRGNNVSLSIYLYIGFISYNVIF